MRLLVFKFADEHTPYRFRACGWQWRRRWLWYEQHRWGKRQLNYFEPVISSLKDVEDADVSVPCVEAMPLRDEATPLHVLVQKQHLCLIDGNDSRSLDSTDTKLFSPGVELASVNAQVGLLLLWWR